MSERGYRRYLPGDEIPLKLEIQHPRMHLGEAGVAFHHEEHPETELSASGPTEVAGNSRVVNLRLSVPPGAAPGLYRANRLWVETYGGRVYDYEGDEVAVVGDRIAFEVLDEPDQKPILRLSYR